MFWLLKTRLDVFEFTSSRHTDRNPMLRARKMGSRATGAERPAPFEYYTSLQLWNDPHISKGMLDAHLDSSHDVASHRREFIDNGVSWMISRFSIGHAAPLAGLTGSCVRRRIGCVNCEPQPIGVRR